MPRFLSTDASPNTTFSDAVRSIGQICSPWTPRTTAHRHVDEVKRFFVESFQAEHAFTFLHGRSALSLTLESFGISSGDEVCIQAFTCVVVPNAITALGATPVYADVDATYNMTAESLQKVLQQHSRVRAVVVQHTFGVAADMDPIVALCKEKGLVLIEDCAHALYSTYKGKLLGTFGDAAIFSFGRDKVISSINGGVAVIRNQKAAQKMTQLIEKTVRRLSTRSLYAHLLHPFVFEVGKVLFQVHPKLYTAWIEVFKKTKLIPLVLTRKEKNGQQGAHYHLPDPLAHRALIQLASIQASLAHRAHITDIYTTLLPAETFQPQHIPEYASHSLLRYTIRHDEMEGIEYALKPHGVYLGHWYDTVIAPKDTSLEGAQYTLGMCPHAEKVTTHIANLPTHISVSEEDARIIAQKILDYTKKV